MPGPYRLFGADLSPYSIKVRNYMRFKGIEHSWIARTAAGQAEFAKFARLPLIPVLVGSDDFALQDSTPIIERLEGQNPEPSIRPEDEALAYLSAVIEDYADEWVNKAMFHYRWTYLDDQRSAAERIVQMMYPQGGPEGAVEVIRERMSSRLHHVGSSPDTLAIIESSFQRMARLIEAHLQSRPYLFGQRPALADFGLAAQVGQLLSDPTPGAFLRAEAPQTAAWVARMDEASVAGPFEPLDDLWPTLKPLFSEEIGALYLPWSVANYAAAKAEGEFRVDLPGGAFIQAPQKYAAKALTDLRRKRAAVVSNEALTALLAQTGCDEALAPLAPFEGRQGFKQAEASNEPEQDDRSGDDRSGDDRAGDDRAGDDRGGDDREEYDREGDEPAVTAEVAAPEPSLEVEPGTPVDPNP